MKITLLTFTILYSFFGLAQPIDFIETADQFFKRHCRNGLVNYKAIKSDENLPKLIEHIAKNKIPVGGEKAYLINVYNLFVIDRITKMYPMGSPMGDPEFYDGAYSNINGKRISLDALENEVLRKEYTDSRLHFVLVCGALGCPPIVDFAYRSDRLDSQLEDQTKAALNNDDFVYQKSETMTIHLSEIFTWYESDFGSNKKEVIAYINKYRKSPFDVSYKVKSYAYDWTINDVTIKMTESGAGNDIDDIPSTRNLQMFTAGSLLTKGKSDITLFNTLYTETKGTWLGESYSGFRTSFMTHLFQYTFGVSKSKRFNIGVDLTFRSAGTAVDSTISGLKPTFLYTNTDTSRVGLTSAGLRVKWQPFKAVSNFTLQSTIMAPTIKHPEGLFADTGKVLHWADWNRITWWNQFYYTKTFGKFQLFTELDFLFRFRVNESQIGMLDLPVSVFLSYFPTRKITVYGMTQHVHRYTNNIDPDNPIITDWVIPSNYTASGIGFKYQLLSNLNLELLYTNFWRGRNSGLGSTFNLGIKFLTK